MGRVELVEFLVIGSDEPMGFTKKMWLCFVI